MEMVLSNGFCEMTQDEMYDNCGGVIPIVIGVACLGLLGVGYTAGVKIGTALWL